MFNFLTLLCCLRYGPDAYIGMHIINLSLGLGSNYRTTPIAVLADKLIQDNNVSVIGAGGNSGEEVRLHLSVLLS